jgi:transketolase
MREKNVQVELQDMRKNIVLASFAAKEGHIPSAFSVLEILYAVKLFDSDFSDKVDLVLSKGHASLALYAMLEKMQVITKEDLMTFCETNSRFGGHPDSKKIPEVMASSGSLGHGFPYSLGLAYAAKASNSDRSVFCVLGDGEFNEGTTWEAALLSKKLNLKNLVCILDKNDSTENVVSLMDIKSVFNSIGWNTWEVNGHDVNEIYKVSRELENSGPSLVVANTIKGKGSSILENNREWHHKAPSNENELRDLMNSIEIS